MLFKIIIILLIIYIIIFFYFFIFIFILFYYILFFFFFFKKKKGEIKNSRKTKQSLLEKSNKISSKYKNEQRKAISKDVNKPKVIQLKAEKVQDHDKSKIVYYYSII